MNILYTLTTFIWKGRKEWSQTILYDSCQCLCLDWLLSVKIRMDIDYQEIIKVLLSKQICISVSSAKLIMTKIKIMVVLLKTPAYILFCFLVLFYCISYLMDFVPTIKKTVNMGIKCYFCSRKNFKILFSAGIILTVVVSISYFPPMRLIYPILPGWLSWAI